MRRPILSEASGSVAAWRGTGDPVLNGVHQGALTSHSQRSHLALGLLMGSLQEQGR